MPRVNQERAIHRFPFGLYWLPIAIVLRQETYRQAGESLEGKFTLQQSNGLGEKACWQAFGW